MISKNKNKKIQMRKIKSYEQFNEEVNWKQLATGAALSGGLMMGAPATGQEVEAEPIVGKYGVNAMEEDKGVLVKDEDIVSGFKMLLEDPRITVEKEYSLVNVYDLGDFDNYRLVLKRKNARPGEADDEIYINKQDFENYVNDGGKLTSSILYQFIEDEELIPAEYKSRRGTRKTGDDSKTFRL